MKRESSVLSLEFIYFAMNWKLNSVLQIFKFVEIKF